MVQPTSDTGAAEYPLIGGASGAVTKAGNEAVGCTTGPAAFCEEDSREAGLVTR
jgi:hypothetical protein